MNAKTLKLVEEIRRELQPLSEQILNHVYFRSLEAGQLTRESLRAFAVQQAHIVGSDLRSVALMVARAHSEGSRAFFLELLEGERAALRALDLFSAAVARAPVTSSADEPLPGAFAYCACVAWLSLYGSEAEFAGALLINLPVWGTNCGRMAEALRSRYGLSDADVAFFTLFASAPPDFEARAAAVVSEGLDRGIDPKAIRRAASLLQGHELLFWDTISHVSKAGA
jgi:hypothetical protein